MPVRPALDDRRPSPGARPSRAAAAVITLLVVLSTLVALPALAQPADGGDDLPRVLPTPQEMTRRGDDVLLRAVVRLVAGEEVDDATVDEVESALRDAGVHRVVRQDPGTRPRGPLTITIGEPAVSPAVADALERVGADGPQDLPADGYVLASGRGRGGQHVVLAGVDADGVFYAAQTLRQLIDDDGRGRARIPGVVVRDWPAMTLRGVIEGFYGTPWTHEQRLRQMDFYGDVKMNVYAYAPKDDPYHRERWDEPYPAEDLAELAELVDRAERNHVEFIFAVSPGLSICYSSEQDLQLLLDKFQAVYDIGVRHFNVALDDINYTDWHCPEDPETFGEGGAAAGRAQSHLLNRVVEEFVATHPDVARLQMVPTEYYNVTETPYKQALRTELDESVIVEWTGTAVVPPTITTEQAAAAVDVFGHDIFVWDNYPVNDYAPGQLLMGPFEGREAGLSEVLHGLHANPMNQAEASRIPLATVADFVWNDDAYDPQQSLEKAIDLFADGDEVLADALRWFVDVNSASILNPGNAPLLSPLVDAFWQEHDADGGDDAAAAALEDALAALGAAPDVIRQRLDNPIFLQETEVWLDAQEHWARAATAALDLLLAQAAGDGDAAWAARQEVVAARDAALALRDDTVPHGQTAPKVGTGVLDVFVAEALDRSDDWLGAAADGPTPTTTLPTYQDNVPARMVDGDLSTFFWSARAVQNGDSVGVDLGSVREVTGIAIAMAKDTSPRDFMQQAVLEISTDGESWTSLGSFSEQPEIAVTPPDGTEARYVRLRATAGQGEWLVVREVDVDVVGGVTRTVTGAPPAAAGSSLDAAADGDPETVYTASRAPAAGEALTVTYSDARPLDAVIVLADGDTAATVEVRRDGTWEAIGDLDGGYTQLAADGEVDGIRLAWAAGSPAPEVAEVIGWFARPAAVTLDVDEVVVESGGDTTVTVSATAGTLDAVPGTVSVTVPEGWSAEPATQELTLERGETVEVPVTVSAPEGSAGDGEVTVTLVVDGATVTATAPARAVPPVTDTNVATSGTATASSVEQDLPQFVPSHAIDGDPATRWSSAHADDEWLQVELAEPHRIGRAVLVWETACGEAYELQGSADGTTWQTLATVDDGDCGTDELRFDSGGPISFVRMQGVDRATAYGYSLYELELYPVR